MALIIDHLYIIPLAIEIKIAYLVFFSNFNEMNLQNRINPLLIWLGLIVLILTIGTGGFIIIENYPFFDALYMTITTISTIGYGEIHELSTTGRVFNIFLIMVKFRGETVQ